MIEPFTYFWILLKASLFSTGGTGNLPSIHADLLLRGWATDRQFAEALAIGQISPGPSGLWVICLGYLTDGLRGALLATLAISLPRCWCWRWRRSTGGWVIIRPCKALCVGWV